MIERIKSVAETLFDRPKRVSNVPKEVAATAETEQQQQTPTMSPATSQTRVIDGTDHYTDLLHLALSHGGNIGNYRIPVRWVRMTLAGLEGRDVAVEETWEDRRLEEAITR